MTPALVTAAITLLGTLAAWAFAWWQRRQAPAPAQQLETIAHEIRLLELQIIRLRRAGDDAGADELLRQLHERLAAQRAARR